MNNPSKPDENKDAEQTGSDVAEQTVLAGEGRAAWVSLPVVP